MESAPTNTAKKKAPPTSSAALPKWARRRLLSGSSSLQTHVQMLITRGFTVVPGVLGEEDVHNLLLCPRHATGAEPRRSLRERSGAQVWRGAIVSIGARIKRAEGVETVCAPLVSRAAGRYDLPLPGDVAQTVFSRLLASRVVELLVHMCPRGQVRTQNVMLSCPGSARQEVHTDSSWDCVRSARHPPAPHYYTVLIPLTVTDELSGCTRIWPGSHTRPQPPGDRFLDCSADLVGVGDALIFDGLLLHLGLENRHSPSCWTFPAASDCKKNRYFYYASFSDRRDTNVDVTGVS